MEIEFASNCIATNLLLILCMRLRALKTNVDNHAIQDIKALFLDPQFWVLLIALTAVATSLTNHEIWLDETEAPGRIHTYGWNIKNLLESFKGDGHLPLYHALLFPILNGGWAINVEAIPLVKVFTFIQYSVFACLICKWVRFPFSIFLLGSYYAFYEYGAISRCYLLAMIFLLVIFRFILTQKLNPIFQIIACFCLPLTHPLSMIIGFPLSIYLLIKRNWLAVTAFFASFVVCLYYLSIQAPEDPFSQFYYLESDDDKSFLTYLSLVYQFILTSWFPLSTKIQWWNQSFINDISSPVLSIFVLSILTVMVILAIVRVYIENWLFGSALSVGVLTCIALLADKYSYGYFRHVGYAAWPFICFLGLALFGKNIDASAPSSQTFKTKLPKKLIQVASLSASCLIVFHFLSGGYAAYKDIRQPFASLGQQISIIDELQASREQELLIFSQPCTTFLPAIVVSNWRYISRPLWHPEGTYCDALPEGTAPAELPQEFLLYTWRSTWDSSNPKARFTFQQPRSELGDIS
ncbi:MAG: hypothetical protein F6K42_13210 [Leptolyngbya sp. SIO1D8]|nr:hypothetical protein [Leptolyngbya sp. SIO1D8]